MKRRSIKLHNIIRRINRQLARFNDEVKVYKRAPKNASPVMDFFTYRLFNGNRVIAGWFNALQMEKHIKIDYWFYLHQ